MKKNIFIFLLLFTDLGLSVAQNPKYASNNRKAIESFESALKCYDHHYNDKALEYLEDAIKEDPAFVDAQIMKGNVLEDMHRYDKAIEAYRQSLIINPDYFPNTFYTLGKLEFRTMKYDSAKVHIEKFLTYKDIRPEFIAKVNLLLKS